MEQVQEERYVFAVEWFDKQADLIRNYLLTFYPRDNSIDMVSILKSILKRLAERIDVPTFPCSNLSIICLLVRFEKQKNVPEENWLPICNDVVAFRRQHRYH